MNRAERRRKNANKSVTTYNLNADQMAAMKVKATADAVDTAFILMLGLPVMVIHDHMTDLWKKTVDGVGREERFLNYVLDLYDSFNRGYVSLEDLLDTIKSETGLDIQMRL